MDTDPTKNTPSTAATSPNAPVPADTDSDTAVPTDRPDAKPAAGRAWQPAQALRGRIGKLAEAVGPSRLPGLSADQSPTPLKIRRGAAAMFVAAAAAAVGVWLWRRHTADRRRTCRHRAAHRVRQTAARGRARLPI
ncbi:hypothetical protein GCM10023088_07490 [Actinomadura verrucosospora]|uniref:hypothetical protein n=1 Tax=Actinomadura verrucosospora TaxID=46165 RepID=UPI0031EB47D3